jgi:hypothetical protein
MVYIGQGLFAIPYQQIPRATEGPHHITKVGKGKGNVVA